MSNWRNECGACGGYKGGCKCPPEAYGGPVTPIEPGGMSTPEMDKAQRDFLRRVEKAVETGDQSEVDERIERYIDTSR